MAIKSLDDYRFFLNGEPVSKCTSNHLEVKMGVNERKRHRRESAKRKRKSSGTITFELPREKPWHERILIKSSENFVQK